MSRGKLPHISRRASAISSSVICMFRSAHNPRRLRRGFADPFFSFKESTNSSTSFCFSGGKSRSFSRTQALLARPPGYYYTPPACDSVPFGSGSKARRQNPAMLKRIPSELKKRMHRFEVLLGDRKGQYSIRINDQRRICFEWPDRSPGPSNVEIVDYHSEDRYCSHCYPSG